MAAIVYPSYTQHVVKANRVAAQAQMVDIANRQQQFLLANRSYVSKTDLEASGYSLPADISARYSYAITLGAGAVPSYTITFTPSGVQTDDGVLTLNNEGVKTPAAKW
ncbi:MAG: prepilin-type cleavage/methylation domain-containing protein [Nitrosospira sp.]|nr:prepilin-type cleavage/methylation domain-containing protein [Nitrosospira sp.]